MRTLFALLCLLSTVSFAGLTGPTVQGPASSTLLGVALWNSTDGTVLQNSQLKLDNTYMNGHNITFQFGESGATLPNDQIITFPLNVGRFIGLIEKSYLGNKFLDWSQGNTGFVYNGLGGVGLIDPTNLPHTNPDTIGVIQMGDTAMTTANPTWVLPTIGATGFPVDTVVVKALAQTLTNKTIGNFLNMSDESAALPLSAVSGIRVLNNKDSLDVVDSNGKLRHIGGMYRVELDFGSTPLTEKSFTITDTESQTSDATVGMDNSARAYVARHTSTGKSYVDEFDMDSFYVGCTPGSGSLVCVVRCLTGQFAGTLNLDYQITPPVSVN